MVTVTRQCRRGMADSDPMANRSGTVDLETDIKPMFHVNNPARSALSPKVARGHKKAALTKAIGGLRKYVSERDLDSVETQLQKLKLVFNDFDLAHDLYNDTLTEETDITESETYYEKVIETYSNAVTEANKWLSGDPDDTGSVYNDARDTDLQAQMQAQMVDLVNCSQAKLEIFSGDPLVYNEFFAMFDEMFHKKSFSDQIKLTRLMQYTSGEAKSAIRHTALMGGSKGYAQARAILQDRFGNPYIIANRTIDNLRSGKAVSSPSEIQHLSDDLCAAKETLCDLHMYSEIDNQISIGQILNRFPRYIRQRWDKKALKSKRIDGKYPDFSNFVDFVKEVASDALDPLYGHESSRVTKPGYKGSCNMSGSSNNDAKNSQGGLKCVECGAQHQLFHCDSFKSKRPADRFNLIKSKNYCYLCLKPGHFSKNCEKRFRCSVPGCAKRHSKFIHLDQRDRSSASNHTGAQNPGSGGSNNSNQGAEMNGSTNASFSHISVYLPVVPVKIGNNPEIYYALLDSASTCTFVVDDLVRQLNLVEQDSNYSISTLSSKTKVRKVVSLDLNTIDGNDQVRVKNVLVVPQIPSKIPNRQIDTNLHSHLQGLPFIKFGNDLKISMLIGMDNAHLIVPYEVKRSPDGSNCPYATLTFFGWTLNGPVEGTSDSTEGLTHVIQGESCIEEQVENLWKIDLEVESTCKTLSEDDKKVLKLWDSDTVLKGNRYWLPIPFKSGTPNMPNNYMMALYRLQSLKKRLDNTGMYPRYDSEVQNYLNKGFAEMVPHDEIELNDGSVWFLPHHHVVNPIKDKVRVVFDCAAKYKGVSLNNTCYQGPNLLNPMLPILLRFRQYPYACMGDLEACYLQTRVPYHHRNVLRFLWYDNDGKLVQLRKTCHTFGAVWAGSASAYVLLRTVQDNDVSDLVKDVICRSFYVDNMARSLTNIEDTRETIYGTRDAVAKGGHNLNQIVVNDKTLTEEIPIELRAREAKEFTSQVVSKALGVQWDVTSDKLFYVNRAVASQKVTRRLILSQVSSMFDPFGLLSCILIRGKILFQEVTRLKLGWDDPVPGHISDRWLSWVDSLNGLEELRFERCLIPDDFLDGAAELVHFSDASQKAYGCVSYLRIINRTGAIRVKLLMSKGRLAPLKELSIVRLELCAAVEATRLDSFIKEVLDVQIVKSTFFTDSEIVRAYIQNDSKRYKVFVANRVSEIRQHTSPSQWFHVPSEINPSDIISRGCLVNDLPELWYSGPDFIHLYKNEWPCFYTASVNENDMEIKEESHLVTSDHVCHNVVTLEHPLDTLASYYGSMYRLKKGLAWLLRFRSFLKSKVLVTGVITAAELKSAERLLISHSQFSSYPNEMSRLMEGTPVAKTSPIVKLDPLIHDGFLVVGGRLRRSDIDHSVKHPIILSNKHRVARLIIQDSHNEGHLGVEWTLSRLRTKYWIVNARNSIKQVKRACVVCRKLYSPVMEQKMADLPDERTEPGKPPFTYTGFDIFGPFYVKSGRAEAKRYGLILTCFTTRAIHLEMLRSLHTDEFLNAMVRFFSRRGYPAKLFCDNAKTFIGAKNELSKSLRELDSDKVRQFTRKLDIEWVFKTPFASHHGGVWERLIRVIRRVLNALLHENSRLTDDIFSTLLCQAEYIINSRPLTKVSDDVDDDAVLTPNHMLMLGSNVPVPLGNFDDADRYRRRWRHVQYLCTQFWKRWLAGYLPLLQGRQKWHRSRQNIKIGDVVLVVDEKLPRLCWPLGLVTDVTVGRDGLIRSAQLKSNGKLVVRPITKLVFLEGCDN